MTVRAIRRTQEPDQRPVYARMLRVRHVNPGTMACYLLFEGSITLGFLVALAELADWWTVVALPMSVALMVKVNDLALGGVADANAQVTVRPPVTNRMARPWRGTPAIGRARVTAVVVRPVGRARVVPRPRLGPAAVLEWRVPGGPPVAWPQSFPGPGAVPGLPGEQVRRVVDGVDPVPGGTPAVADGADGTGGAPGWAGGVPDGAGASVDGPGAVLDRSEVVFNGAGQPATPGRYNTWPPDRSGAARHRLARQRGSRVMRVDSPADRVARHSASQRYR